VVELITPVLIRTVADFKKNIEVGDEFFELTTEYSKPTGVQKCMLMEYLGEDRIAEQIIFGPIGKPNQKGYLFSFWATRFGGVMLNEVEANYKFQADLLDFESDTKGMTNYLAMLNGINRYMI
jgi:hypothetical protein